VKNQRTPSRTKNDDHFSVQNLFCQLICSQIVTSLDIRPMFAKFEDLGISSKDYARLEEASSQGDLEKGFQQSFVNGINVCLKSKQQQMQDLHANHSVMQKLSSNVISFQ
jgi:predicted metal-binding transcription factor (methanogenesis marker protein 9)